jgi:hypothetical protein
MKPLAINFAPRRPLLNSLPDLLPKRARWFAGGVGALLVIVSSAAWLTTSPVEASHMSAPSVRHLPDVEEVHAVDAAVRELNLPWLAALDAFATTFGQDNDAVLLRIEADAQRAVIRLSGAARETAGVQRLPARLRAAGPFAAATLISQETKESSPLRPVHFVIELILRDGT